ncbi:MAG TPA: NAD-dependent epimerase/dehydratase family protein [Pelolinea sp.]|nr:NAD-dependent epimerase/dehydratase family protein [Pelolinea sp.]
MTSYLVTGAAGFIASKVCEFLLDQGHQVIGVDNLDPVYDLRIKRWRLDRLTPYDGFTFHEKSICDRSAMDRIFKNHSEISAVINLAAKAGVRDSVIDPWSYYETNVTGTLNLLELCRHQGIRKFILASTSSIYGEDAPYPTPEDAESSFPLQPYAASKKAAETLCYSYHYLYKMDITVLRYFTVYGPAGRPGMSMFRFTRWISEEEEVQVFGDGNQTRGFTYLDDIARGTIAALKPLGYEIINLGGHESISIKDLIAKFENAIGKKAKAKHYPAHPADMSASWADISKAKQILSWEPGISLDEGIQNVIQWYRQEHHWASQVDTE